MSEPDKPRQKALDILRLVETGAFADVLLEEARQSFGHRDNAFIRELVYGALRNRLRLDWMLNLFSERPVEKADAWTRNILRLGAYQLLFLDRVPSSAAVNTATELAKQHGKKPGYVNGLLRTLDRQRSSLREPNPADIAVFLSVKYSHPRWLVTRWVKRFGLEAAERLLRANNGPAPLTIRTNILRTSREGLKASLKSEGAAVAESRYSPVGLEIRSSPGIHSLTAFREGWFLVQDEAAQLISLMLAPRPGEAVLDACAAPGGKTTHLAELMRNEGSITALESDPVRIRRISENAQRLGIAIIMPVRADAAGYYAGLYDHVLIDAPCSGLGVLRRHPDGRWNKKEDSIKKRAKIQKRILENCARLLKPGGALVYATCTTEPEENEDLIELFLAGHDAEFSIDDPRPFLPDRAAELVDQKGFFRTYPAQPEMDGFFGVRLVKKPGSPVN